jgi:hypothetical protein
MGIDLMQPFKVFYEPDSNQYLECDECQEQLDEVWFLCRWDTEHKRYYVSIILCKLHIDGFA